MELHCVYLQHRFPEHTPPTFLTISNKRNWTKNTSAIFLGPHYYIHPIKGPIKPLNTMVL